MKLSPETNNEEIRKLNSIVLISKRNRLYFSSRFEKRISCRFLTSDFSTLYNRSSVHKLHLTVDEQMFKNKFETISVNDDDVDIPPTLSILRSNHAQVKTVLQNLEKKIEMLAEKFCKHDHGYNSRTVVANVGSDSSTSSANASDVQSINMSNLRIDDYIHDIESDSESLCDTCPSELTDLNYLSNRPSPCEEFPPNDAHICQPATSSSGFYGEESAVVILDHKESDDELSDDYKDKYFYRKNNQKCAENDHSAKPLNTQTHSALSPGRTLYLQLEKSLKNGKQNS